jgi:hypothetical protein
VFPLIQTSECNLKYYPYSIVKIIEMVLDKPEDQERKQAIIDCVHFQRDNTVVSNDKTWKKVCDRVPCFTYKKTDRNLMHSN